MVEPVREYSEELLPPRHGNSLVWTCSHQLCLCLTRVLVYAPHRPRTPLRAAVVETLRKAEAEKHWHQCWLFSYTLVKSSLPFGSNVFLLPAVAFLMFLDRSANETRDGGEHCFIEAERRGGSPDVGLQSHHHSD